MSNIQSIIFALIIVFIVIFGVGLYLIIKNNSNDDHIILTGCKFNRWGCCSDNITAKKDQSGTNCMRPIFRGCKETKYGCCPDNITSKRDIYGTNCEETRRLGGCKGTRYGCCTDGVTTKRDRYGTNCEYILY